MESQKLPNCCVTLHSSSLQRNVSTPHSSYFGVSRARLPARLAFGAFYLAITLDDFLRVHHYLVNGTIELIVKVALNETQLLFFWTPACAGVTVLFCQVIPTKAGR